jgi:hypothetical protein
LLHLDGAVYRVDHARKISQQAIARGADDPAILRNYQWVNSLAQTSKRLMRSGIILAHEAAESDHIGMQDRGKLPLLRGSLLARLRRAIGLGSQAGLTSL